MKSSKESPEMTEKKLSIEFTFEEERITMGGNGFKQPNSEMDQKLRGYAEKIREVLELTDTKTPVISEKERIETLQRVADQSKEWWDHQKKMVKLTCPCGIKESLLDLYRCFYCGIFFCKGCAFHHFEDDEHE